MEVQVYGIKGAKAPVPYNCVSGDDSCMTAGILDHTRTGEDSIVTVHPKRLGDIIIDSTNGWYQLACIVRSHLLEGWYGG